MKKDSGKNEHKNQANKKFERYSIDDSEAPLVDKNLHR